MFGEGENSQMVLRVNLEDLLICGRPRLEETGGRGRWRREKRERGYIVVRYIILFTS